ncbi:unnamed protein product, partial [Sphagnum balticum]
LQWLLPLKRALTEVEHDVHDTHIAMEQVLDSDDMLESLCLNNNEYAWPGSGIPLNGYEAISICKATSLEH